LGGDFPLEGGKNILSPPARIFSPGGENILAEDILSPRRHSRGGGNIMGHPANSESHDYSETKT